MFGICLLLRDGKRYTVNILLKKPINLLARVIAASTRPGAWILDPFAGSSTTGVTANLLKRRFLGIDIEQKVP